MTFKRATQLQTARKPAAYDASPDLTFRSSTICPQSYFPFYMVLRRNRDYLPMLEWLINFETEIQRQCRAVRSQTSDAIEVNVLS